MKIDTDSMNFQLRETARLTGVNWAVWLEQGEDWNILAEYGLNKSGRAHLVELLRGQEMKTWLELALEGERLHSKKIPFATGLATQKVFVFPNFGTRHVILLGADALSSEARMFWRVVARGNSVSFDPDPTSAPFPFDSLDVEIPYHLPEALDHILAMVLKAVSCESGWLAIRSGEYFEIRAHSDCKDCAGAKISLDAYPFLQQVVAAQQARLVGSDDPEWSTIPRLGLRSSAQEWGVFPLAIGRRLIGLVAVWQKSAISSDGWELAKRLTHKVAPSVEASVAFADLSSHLRRMSLLNDFAVTIASVTEPEQIAQRVFAFLRHAFGTDRVYLVLQSVEDSGIQKFSNYDGSIMLQTLSSEDVPSLWLIDAGGAYRIDSITSESEYEPAYPGSRSALTIPMKYHHQMVGLLGLESVKEGAFLGDDEHLLAVIASHLAGLLENVRLRSEAEKRARNLGLIHEVVAQIIGLTDSHEIAQISAELMARNFAYELSVVALFDETENKLKIAGMGGNAADIVAQELRQTGDTRRDGIMMRVAVTGENMIVNDTAQNPFFHSVPNWNAGSEMCVALRDGDRVLGVIDVGNQRKNAFSQNDLIVLESLAGILSSVISSAGQYQRLQTAVEQLQQAREELQERIAAQQIAESRLVQAAKLAAVGEMAAGVAHELNNPLTTALGFTELVLEDIPQGSDTYRNLELVLREGQRARDVVRRLLDFSRQGESVHIRSSVNEIVADILALVNHLLRTSGIQVRTSLTKELPWVSVDQSQMKQVLLNLIHNALHAMPTGGDLHISTESRRRDQSEWVVIAVKDAGMGIAPEDIRRVFEPFFTTRSKDGGTGLGLSVSYGIVADHGGSIEVESQVGKGSTFSVWLPVEVPA